MAQRATSLGPKPSLFSFCFLGFLFFFFAFLSLFFLIDKKPVFPLKKGTFCLFFSVSLCFSLAFLGLLPFLHFLFLCLSLLVFSFFLPSCFSFSLSGSCFFFLLCLLFLFQDVLLFLLFCLLSCVVLNHNISFMFALHLVFWLLFFFVLVAFIFCYFLIFGNLSKNISEKHGKFEKQQKSKMQKKKKRTF